VAGAEAVAHEAHRRIFEAVAARDPEAAGRAMEQHLEDVAALVSRALEEGNGVAAGDPG